MENDSNEVRLEFSLPEFEEKDINVDVSRDSINISAYKKQEQEDEGKDFLHQEKTQRSFIYNSNLPEVEADKMKKTFSGGILNIEIPKR